AGPGPDHPRSGAHHYALAGQGSCRVADDFAGVEHHHEHAVGHYGHQWARAQRGLSSRFPRRTDDPNGTTGRRICILGCGDFWRCWWGWILRGVRLSPVGGASMSFQIVRKIGHTYRSGVHLYQVAALVSGDVLRRYLEEPWKTPGGAIAIPDGFSLKEHTHQQDMPASLPGHLAGASDPWSFTQGDTLTISVDSDPVQTATLVEGDAVNFSTMTAAEMIAVFARDFVGAS